MTIRKDGLETRQRIVEAAAKIFGDLGFRETTNAAICELADVNTASINYHFGSKAALYVAAWEYLQELAESLHPHLGGVSGDASPEERMKGRIRGLVGRLTDRENLGSLHAMMLREHATPSGLLEDRLQAMRGRMRSELGGIIEELLGSRSTEQDICFCERSVIGQCFMIKPPHHRHTAPIEEVDPQEITEHIYRFSLAGIRAVREYIDKRLISDEISEKLRVRAPV
jgi:TetR/AcrR family transcriptional regulator, regulator of cefoperazone and chloramphenicol sensitivity